MDPKFTKMSKSKGNAISVDEIVTKVRGLAPGYEFLDLGGDLVDWDKRHVWFKIGLGYFTGQPREAVFLHIVGNPIPAFLTTMETQQHPECVYFWRKLVEKYDTLEAVNDYEEH